MSRNSSLFGIFLILAGCFLLLERLELISGDIFLLLLGTTFIATYFVKNRSLGLLVAGSLLTWIGLYTVILEQAYWPILEEYAGGLLFFAMGCAFGTLFIHTHKDQNKLTRYWPLYTGIALIVFALVVEFEFSFIPGLYLNYISRFWPVLLVILGFFFFLTSIKSKDESE